jgi:hypothetical protein
MAEASMGLGDILADSGYPYRDVAARTPPLSCARGTLALDLWLRRSLLCPAEL